jgi:hypothetical protein
MTENILDQKKKKKKKKKREYLNEHEPQSMLKFLIVDSQQLLPFYGSPFCWQPIYLSGFSRSRTLTTIMAEANSTLV